MKKDIIPFNNLGQKHGYWKRHNSDGSFRWSAHYINGIEIGYSITKYVHCKVIHEFFIP